MKTTILIVKLLFWYKTWQLNSWISFILIFLSQGQELNEAQTECVDCRAGTFQDSKEGGTCRVCSAGHYSHRKSSVCTKCSLVGPVAATNYQLIYIAPENLSSSWNWLHKNNSIISWVWLENTAAYPFVCRSVILPSTVNEIRLISSTFDHDWRRTAH